MANLSGFDASQVEPPGDFGPIPPGKYLAVITDSEMKPTKAGNGSYLQLTFQILEGDYANRRLWARLNLDNPSEIAIRIAKAELSAICRAVEILTPQASADLHNLPLVIQVVCEKRPDTGAIVNKVKGYSKQKPPQPPDTTSPTADSTPPWKRL